MKVLISGTKLYKKPYSCELSDEVTKWLDKLILNDATILIGDNIDIDIPVQKYLNDLEYKNVVVYSKGIFKSSSKNFGKWKETTRRPSGKPEDAYAYTVERIFHIAEDADYGIVIWDEKRLEDYIIMLCLVALGKHCELYLCEQKRWITIQDIDDLREFKGQDRIISAAEIHTVMSKCGFSDEMVEYAVSENAVAPYILLDVICGAPISIHEKSRLLGILIDRDDLKPEAFDSVYNNIKENRSFKRIKHDLRAILDYRGKPTIWTKIAELYRLITRANSAKFESPFAITCDKPLYLFTEWYDLEEIQHKSSPCGLFTSPSRAKEYIKKEESDNDSGEGYYRMEAWDLNDDFYKSNRFDYYLDNNGTICWFEELTPTKDDTGNVYYTTENREFITGKHDLSFRTPYKTGDIVLIDCRPFGPPFHAMILEADDQNDCCFPNIIFKVPGTEMWRLTPLKHKRFYKDISWGTYEPVLSPFYHLRRVKEEEFTASDDELLKLRGILSGSESKAEKIWENWSSDNGEDMLWDGVEKVFNGSEGI